MRRIVPAVLAAVVLLVLAAPAGAQALKDFITWDRLNLAAAVDEVFYTKVDQDVWRGPARELEGGLRMSYDIVPAFALTGKVAYGFESKQPRLAVGAVLILKRGKEE